MEKVQNDNHAIILLHEIYGIDGFIQDRRQRLQKSGYHVFCPNMIGREPFTQKESRKAYNFFMKNVGFDIYKEVDALINELKERYHKVFIMGFSAGGTIGWRCCENMSCDGIISCYGSRIRDYTDLNPTCPTLLLFAKKESFDVQGLIGRLRDKKNLSIFGFDASHGFLNPYSKAYNEDEAERAEELIHQFLRNPNTSTKV
ncbi:MAG TPA: dienelactone hydrolase family protein [Clostridia bacterium]|nr:dienelactone hydrolase family protein [Clostridia bacterium]